MKEAVLIFNMPDSCRGCRMFIQEFNYHCLAKYWCTEEDKEWLKYNYARCKPDWCPLKALPEYGVPSVDPNPMNCAYAQGWNDCLDNIRRLKNNES